MGGGCPAGICTIRYQWVRSPRRRCCRASYKHPNSVSRWISSGRAPEDVEAILARVLKELEKSMVNSDSATRLLALAPFLFHRREVYW
jgi:xanthine/CO dehydrogenase XdhC/CoxF family maturation factor